MGRRCYRLPSPADAEHVCGEGFEFKAEHDRVNAGKQLPPPVELIPVGPAPTIYEFRPEHDTVAKPESVPDNGQSSAPPAEGENSPSNAANGTKKTRKRKKPPTGD